MIIFYFALFLTIILAIGLYAKRFSQNTTEDYLLASGDIPVWQTVLSALASNYSGVMYTGFIGYTYINGLSTVWLMGFWVLGEMLIMLYAPKKINETTKKHGLKSYNQLMANYWGGDQVKLQKIAAIITVAFLSIYAAAQFSAAGKVINSSLDLPITLGVVLAYVIVLAYCFSGGIRASIWTDSLQFVIMLFSIAILVFTALNAIGGWGAFIEKLYQYPAAYTQLFPDSMGGWFFIVLFCLGWLASGIGTIGQPHIAIRYMTMRKTIAYKKMLIGYYILVISFVTLCVLSGLLAKVYFTGAASSFDAEVSLPQLATTLLHPALAGLVLAGILSAIISTADSQILSSSASLGSDLLPKKATDKENLRQNKFTTVLIATIAIVVTLYGNQSIFALVLVAWSGLAAAFTPILLLKFLGYKMSESLSIVIVLSGLTIAIIWRLLSLNEIISEAFTGMLTGFIVFIIANLIIKIEKNT